MGRWVARSIPRSGALVSAAELAARIRRNAPFWAPELIAWRLAEMREGYGATFGEAVALLDPEEREALGLTQPGEAST